MADDKILRLVNGLIEKTKADELVWETTSNENTFQVAFSEHTITIEEYVDTDNDLVLMLAIFDSEGRKIDSANQWSVANVKELYDLARRWALGVDEALDSLLEELGG